MWDQQPKNYQRLLKTQINSWTQDTRELRTIIYSIIEEKWEFKKEENAEQMTGY